MVYLSVADEGIKELGNWQRREYDELNEGMERALDHVEILEGEELIIFLRDMKRRIGTRRRYIDSNFGVVGYSVSGGITKRYPKPDLITGEEINK